MSRAVPLTVVFGCWIGVVREQSSVMLCASKDHLTAGRDSRVATFGTALPYRFTAAPWPTRRYFSRPPAPPSRTRRKFTKSSPRCRRSPTEAARGGRPTPKPCCCRPAPLRSSPLPIPRRHSLSRPRSLVEACPRRLPLLIPLEPSPVEVMLEAPVLLPVATESFRWKGAATIVEAWGHL